MSMSVGSANMSSGNGNFIPPRTEEKDWEVFKQEVQPKRIEVTITIIEDGGYEVVGMIKQGDINLGGTFPSWHSDIVQARKKANKLLKIAIKQGVYK